MRFANCFERVAISKAKLIPLVFFRRHVSATFATSASLRPFFALIAFATGRLGVLEIRRLEHVIFIRILLFPAEPQRLVW